MQKERHNEILRYIIFGAATTAVNWVFYVICVRFLSLSITWSNAIAWLLAVIFAYITNKLFVFGSRGLPLPKLAKEIALFFGSRLLSGIADILLPTALVLIGLSQTAFGIKGFWAKVITTAFVIVMNYVMSKIIVFRKK